MGVIKDMLGSGETLFRDPIPLDYDYIPKLVPYRESQQRQISLCIRPLLEGRNGRNMFIHGAPGVGKTVVCKHLLKALEEEDIEEAENIVPIYINCWQKNTFYKIVLGICEMIGYRFTHNKKSDELFKIVKENLNKKSVVFVLDEVDKLEEQDFIYNVLEEIYKKTVILITNYKEWIVNLDQRIKSRLTAELMEFKPYNKQETFGVLKDRLQYAFVPGAWDDDAFNLAAEKTYDMGDIRAGLYLLKESGNAAEDASSKKINAEHVSKAIGKLEEFSIKKKESLEDDTKFILEIIKNHSGNKIGDIFKEYQNEGGKAVYKTFQRKVNKLAEDRFITVKKIMGGAEGTTTIVKHAGSMKKITDF
ncbi:AAA family ATPase [Candidatus Woesearchaeota archaeon]|nr:AAA family ATPase [Candidatus Woesearchaeota archaeon]